jgi:hypothetical protein
MLLNMKSVYHIVTICVNETSWAHLWRFHSLYLRTGYDKWYQSCVPSIFQIICQSSHLTLSTWFYKIL